MKKIKSNNVRKPDKVNTIATPSRQTLRIAQGILNNYGLYLVLECGQRLKKGSRKMCRGRVKLTSKGNLRCSVCLTKWIGGYRNEK